METEDIILDGKKIRIIKKLSDEEMDDTLLVDELEKTIDLSEVANEIKNTNGENYE